MPKNNKNDDSKSSIDIPEFINYKEADECDSFLQEVNSSLAQQIDSEFQDDFQKDDKPRRKKRMSKLIKIPLILLVVFLMTCSFLMFTGPGQKIAVDIAGNYIYSNLEFQPTDSQPASSDGVINTLPKDGENNQVINILLIGIEQIKGDQNTDSMIVASMNTKDHTVKLTSLMRDLYVDIPGYKKGRLNTAYARGGIETLYETIEKNFGITIDGYCMVSFDAFEKIVDLVGGVEVTLTKKEAHYLNTTNYISEKANRNVVEGTQLMNGNQALGYCRVRHVPTATENSDFGRTQRQRMVLQAIYDKLRSKNIVQQILIMNDILKEADIKTDITKKEFTGYMEEAVSLNIKEIKTLRIPTDKNYEDLRVNNAAVIQPKDWDATREDIHNFIYGEDSKN